MANGWQLLAVARKKFRRRQHIDIHVTPDTMDCFVSGHYHFRFELDRTLEQHIVVGVVLQNLQRGSRRGESKVVTRREQFKQ